jgi:addiction module RelE/StbE family toxin
MKRLAWSPRARTQLAATFEYIAQDDPDAAQGVLDTILHRAERLIEFPELGSPSRYGTRKLVVIGLPYVLVYRVAGDVVRISAVWHSAQRRKR